MQMQGSQTVARSSPADATTNPEHRSTTQYYQAESLQAVLHSASGRAQWRDGKGTAPEERRLDEADGLAVPAVLLAHGQHRDAHVDAVHVAQHEREEAQRDDRPAPLPERLADRCLCLCNAVKLKLGATSHSSTLHSLVK